MKTARFEMKTSLWISLLNHLKERGKGIRESGAFLLSAHNTNQISEFLCYDDLDPEAYKTGIITFKSEAYIPLWDYCIKKGLMVVADIHTHPANWTGQSIADKANPMIVQRGHIALIAPKYAKRIQKNLRGIGVYEYLGDYKWKTHSRKSSIIKFKN